MQVVVSGTGATVHVQSCTFGNSSSVAGGALAIHNGSVTIEDSTFVNNTAQIKGGAIAVTGGILALTRSTLIHNTVGAADGGGAIHVGGGVVSWPAQAQRKYALLPLTQTG